MSRSRVDKLISMGLKFNGTYFVFPANKNNDTKIRHDEVATLSHKAFKTRCKYIETVMEG